MHKMVRWKSARRLARIFMASVCAKRLGLRWQSAAATPLFDCGYHGLVPSLLLREKELILSVSVFAADRSANPAAGFAKDAARVSPSPW